jgi:lipopolysaccharide/colanic/teichoic acid biosynthesis glycosyltransferase
MYRKFFKRFFDIVLSGMGIIILLPLFIICSITGAIFMRGNPFFLHPRPGKNEKIFKLIKFRTMLNLKEENGNWVNDTKRLNKYGKFLRATSIDELLSLLNVFVGHMSLVGPRPLSVLYLPYYNEKEKHRHDVRPGLTGLAQVKGRNSLSWEQRFEYDLEYIRNISLINDIKILFKTVKKVLKHDDIGQAEEKPIAFHVLRKQELEKNNILRRE